MQAGLQSILLAGLNFSTFKCILGGQMFKHFLAIKVSLQKFTTLNFQGL